MRICDKCSGKITEGSKYCPHCGDPVTEADVQESSVVSTNQSRCKEAVIKFGYSSSQKYQQAITICEKIETYSCEGEGKDITHSISLPLTEVELILTVWAIVGSWKSTTMLIDGRHASKQDLVQGGMGCFQRRQQAYDPNQFCFGENEYDYNIWGCKRMGMPLRDFYTGWLTYGQADAHGIWRFDKAKIRHQLELKTHENEFCPVISPQEILETLSRFPDSVNPQVDPNWDYITEWKELDGRHCEVVTGVKPVLKNSSFYILREDKPYFDDEDDDLPRTIEMKINVPDDRIRHSRKPPKNNGCMVLIISLTAVFIVWWIILSILL